MVFDTQVNAETKILEAAKSVFTKKGLEGTTMQEIADEAGISRTSLHYYFRNKEKLFEYVFTGSMNKITPKFNEIIEQDTSLCEKVADFVHQYIDVLADNPLLPAFIFHEANRNPQSIIDVFKNKGIKLDKLALLIFKEKSEGKIGDVSLEHFITNLISLCVFPFLAKPLMDEFLFDNKAKLFEDFIQERKSNVTNLLIYSLTSNVSK